MNGEPNQKRIEKKLETKENKWSFDCIDLYI